MEPEKTPEDIIRDPYVLEFLGLSPNDDFYESDLEQALITHLQKYCLILDVNMTFILIYGTMYMRCFLCLSKTRVMQIEVCF